MLGTAVGLLMEMFDRRVRSTQDITETLEIPVLGELFMKKPHRHSRLIPHQAKATTA
jgi:capsular polysaccharide biosynthesis protein